MSKEFSGNIQTVKDNNLAGYNREVISNKNETNSEYISGSTSRPSSGVRRQLDGDRQTLRSAGQEIIKGTSAKDETMINVDVGSSLSI